MQLQEATIGDIMKELDSRGLCAVLIVTAPFDQNAPMACYRSPTMLGPTGASALVKMAFESVFDDTDFRWATPETPLH